MHERLLTAAIEYDKGDPKRIQHFIKVHSFARLIGKQEKLSDEIMKALETAAILHDIGIHDGERLYGRNDGEIRQKLGPGIAKEILVSVGGYEDVTERVMHLIARHHTYTDIDGKDLQILIEADFIVNLYEDSASKNTVRNAYEKIFVTESGKKILKDSFGI